VVPKTNEFFVSCINKEKGAPAKKNCAVACIGCGKCEKVCKFDAITITSFLAYIDFSKCTLCRKCVEVCPTNAIHEINFRPRKPKPEKPKIEAPSSEKSISRKSITDNPSVLTTEKHQRQKILDKKQKKLRK